MLHSLPEIQQYLNLVKYWKEFGLKSSCQQLLVELEAGVNFCTITLDRGVNLVSHFTSEIVFISEKWKVPT